MAGVDVADHINLIGIGTARLGILIIGVNGTVTTDIDSDTINHEPKIDHGAPAGHVNGSHKPSVVKNTLETALFG